MSPPNRRIILVELICERFEHSKFNSLLISSIRFASQDDTVIEFWGEVNHCSCIQRLLEQNVLKQIVFRPFLFGSKFSNRRVRFLIYLITTIFRSVFQSSKFIFLSGNTPTIFASALCRSVGSRIHVLHSYYPRFLQLLRNSKRGISSIILNKIALCGSVFVVLRDDIILAANVGRDNIVVKHIEHPIGRVDNVRYPKNDRLTIGFLGRATTDKGFDHFERICRKLQMLKINFVHIGPGSQINQNLRGPTERVNSQLSDLEFSEKIRKLTAVFVANKNSAYQFVASGVISDSIEKSIPLIGIRDTYIKYLEDKYGSLGYFFDTENELATWLLHNSESELIPIGSINNDLLAACAYNSPKYIQSIIEAMEIHW